MKKFLLVSFKFCFPLFLLLAAGEGFLRFMEHGMSPWFMWLAKEWKQHPYDNIFVGTSMTRVAFDSAEFEREYNSKTGKHQTAINMGEAYTTMPEYYFALRKLVLDNPGCLKGKRIFIECPAGIPKFEYWTDDWMQSQYPRLLADFISWADVLHYYQVSHASFGEKAMLACAKVSFLATYGGRIPEGVLNTIEEKLNPPSSTRKSKVDLTNAGGVRTDEAGVVVVRGYVQKTAESNSKNQKPIDWNKAVVKDLVDFLHQEGAEVYFFSMPVSSVYEKPFVTSQRQSDKKNFESACASWHCPLLKPVMTPTLTDEDFPDLLHLRASLASSFTRELADRCVDAEKP